MAELVRLTSDAEKAKAVQLEVQLEALAKGPYMNFFGEKVRTAYWSLR